MQYAYILPSHVAWTIVMDTLLDRSDPPIVGLDLGGERPTGQNRTTFVRFADIISRNL